MRYFKKNLLSNPFWFANGRKVTFEDLGGNVGGLATEDSYAIEQMESAISRKIGGIVEVTAEQWDELKKKEPTKPKPKPELLSALSLDTLRSNPQRPKPSAVGPVVRRAPPVVTESAPLVVPDNLPLVRSVKLPPLPKTTEVKPS